MISSKKVLLITVLYRMNIIMDQSLVLFAGVRKTSVLFSFLDEVRVGGGESNDNGIILCL